MLTFDFSNFPALTTERLTLRGLHPNDGADLYDLRTREEMSAYLDREPARSLDEAQLILENLLAGQARNEWITWVLSPKGTTTFLGSICIWQLAAEARRGELGFELHPDWQGKGYMLEAGKAVVEYAFGPMGLTTLWARTREDNRASVHLLERLGFERIEILRETVQTENGRMREARYQLLKGKSAATSS